MCFGAATLHRKYEIPIYPMILIGAYGKIYSILTFYVLIIVKSFTSDWLEKYAQCAMEKIQ